MSAAAAAEAAPPAKGKKKLIMIIAVALAVVLGGGGAALMLTKKKHADAEAEADGGDEHAPAKAAKKDDHKAAPVFVPLEPFTVNLADRESERYAQVGITLEIDDAKTGEQIKAYMPAIRNNILMAIADRTAADLMGRDGKAQLAEKVKRETSKALGFDVPDEEEAAADDEGDEKPKAKAKKKKKKKAEVTLPVRAVHFSNFIIQ